MNVTSGPDTEAVTAETEQQANADLSLLASALDLTKALVQRPSVTPDDAGCQRLLSGLLAPLGFQVHWLYAAEVSNLLLYRPGTSPAAPHLMFLGHTDVVPAGDLTAWTQSPFTPWERHGLLYGRGVADMKGAVAAMVVALARFVDQHKTHSGSVSLLLTSDEEGPSQNGVRVVAPWLAEQGLLPDYCLVGEPSCKQQLGDTVRIGRRGSIHGSWVWCGEQGHTAYIDPAANPLHRALKGLAAVSDYEFDSGDEAFPSTRFNFVRVLSDSGANNITPSRVEAAFNIRNNPASPSAELRLRLEQILRNAGALPDESHWQVSGEPFMTAGAVFRDAVLAAVSQHTAVTAEANTGGGTSDGRFLAPLGVEVVEFGLLNQSIHKVDEHCPSRDIEQLAEIYQALCQRLLV